MTEPADRKTRLDGLAVACMLLCCSIWGLNQVATKVTLADVPPFLQAALRSLGSAVLLAIWSRVRGISLSPGNGTLAGGLAAGALFAAEFGCIFWGLQHTTASRMGVFLYLSPFVVALGMPFVARAERLGVVQWAGLVTAFCGVAWALSEGWAASTRPATWVGDALGVLAAVLWGATTLVIRGSRLATAPAEQTLFYQLAVSALLLGLGSWLAGERWPALHTLGWRPLGLLLFQIVVVTFASFLLWFWLMRHYPTTRLATFALLTPMASLLSGVVLLGDPFTLRLVVACITVAIGIALVNRSPPTTPAPSPTRASDHR